GRQQAREERTPRRTQMVVVAEEPIRYARAVVDELGAVALAQPLHVAAERALDGGGVELPHPARDRHADQHHADAGRTAPSEHALESRGLAAEAVVPQPAPRLPEAGERGGVRAA